MMTFDGLNWTPEELAAIQDGRPGRVVTREPQYAPCFQEEPVTLGPMAGSTWRWNPRRLGMVLARYKFVSKMLAGFDTVAEIGCGDGFCSEVVKAEVGELHLFDFDKTWQPYASQHGMFFQHDIVRGPISNGQYCYDAIYMIDVLEHIHPDDEAKAIINIKSSLLPNGVFIAGVPSLESQKYASDISKVGHVNCRTGDDLRAAMRAHFSRVFLFSMNDEVVHTGFSPMAHYLFVVCTK